MKIIEELVDYIIDNCDYTVSFSHEYDCDIYKISISELSNIEVDVATDLKSVTISFNIGDESEDLTDIIKLKDIKKFIKLFNKK